MKTYAILNANSDLIAFELDIAYISRKEIAGLVKTSPRVTDVDVQARFGSPDDIRVRFAWAGERFMVWEPYGDNSRYWIGPEDSEHPSPNVKALKEIFDLYQPSFLKRLLGDLMTLQMFKANR